MAQPGGPKRGATPNQYALKTQCECDAPLIDPRYGDCVKCGHKVAGLVDRHEDAWLARGSLKTKIAYVR